MPARWTPPSSATRTFEALSSWTAVLIVSTVAATFASMARSDSRDAFRAPAMVPISSRLRTCAGTVRSPFDIASTDPVTVKTARLISRMTERASSQANNTPIRNAITSSRTLRALLSAAATLSAFIRLSMVCAAPVISAVLASDDMTGAEEIAASTELVGGGGQPAPPCCPCEPAGPTWRPGRRCSASAQP